MLLFARTTTWLLILFLVGLACALLWWPLNALFVHIPLSYNEGWNAFHALRLRTGGPLYPPISPAIFINYPPLSFYLVAGLANLIGDDIVAGRILALAALAITMLNVGLAARRLGGPLEIAIAAALAFFCFIAIFFTDYVAVNDPQWLAHAFQSTGLVVLLGRRRGWRELIIIAALMVAGGLVKHNVLSLPVAITLWLALEDRTALRRWIVAGATLGAALLALCLAIYGTTFLTQLIGSRTTSLDVLILVGRHWGPQIAPFLIVGALGAFLWRHDSRGRFVAIYLAVSLATGAVLMTGSGVIYNTLFDLVIAMMLGCALALRRLVELSGNERTRALLLTFALLLYAVRFIVITPGAQNGYKDMIVDLERRDLWAATIERIRTEPEPVACETLALCYWAGRSSEIEFFNYGQKALREPGYDAAFSARLGRGEIGLIQRDIAGGASRLPTDLEAVIAAHYRHLGDIPTALWIPIH
ncbi:MAG: glycosyltransferase family 39 protein [Devosia sp.]